MIEEHRLILQPGTELQSALVVAVLYTSMSHDFAQSVINALC